MHARERRAGRTSTATAFWSCSTPSSQIDVGLRFGDPRELDFLLARDRVHALAHLFELPGQLLKLGTCRAIGHSHPLFAARLIAVANSRTSCTVYASRGSSSTTSDTAGARKINKTQSTM
jgi:hypothetical protein